MPKQIVKKRNWGFIMYPESAPPDWKDILEKTGLQIVVSPLHDQDKNPDGENKKEHWHVMACYSGPTSSRVVQQIADSVHATNVQAIESVRGMFRYFTHEDNPEKAHYSPDDITTINGFDIKDFSEFTRSEVIKIKKQVHEFIRDNNIMEYSVLLDFLLDGDLMDEYEIACNNTVLFDRYISSRRHRAESIQELKERMTKREE